MAANYTYNNDSDTSHDDGLDDSSHATDEAILYATGAVMGGGNPSYGELSTGSSSRGYLPSQSSPDPNVNVVNPPQNLDPSPNPLYHDASSKPKRRYPKPQTPPMSRTARLRELEELDTEQELAWLDAQNQSQQGDEGSIVSGQSYDVPFRRSSAQGLAIDPPVQFSRGATVEPLSPTSGLHRTNSKCSSRTNSSRDKGYAPARSPLQKLEGTLKDISKEEKRAKLESAIRMLKESKEKGLNENMSPRDSEIRVKNVSMRKRDAPSRQSSYRDYRKATGGRSPSSPTKSVDMAWQKQPQKTSYGRRNSGVSSIHSEIQESMAKDFNLSPQRHGHGNAEFHSMLETRRLNVEPIVLPQRSKTDSNAQTRQRQMNEEPEQFLLDPGVPSDDERLATKKSFIDRRATASPWREPQRREVFTTRRPLPEPPHPGEERSRTPYGIPTPPAQELQGKADNSSPSRSYADAAGNDNNNHLRVPSQDTFESTGTTSKPKHKFKVSFPDLPPPTPTPLMEWKNASVGRLRIADFDLDHVDIGSIKGGSFRSQRSRRSTRQQGSLRKSIIEPPRTPSQVKRSVPFNPPLHLECGPMLKYNGIKLETFDGVNGPDVKEVWRGSMMIVTRDSLSTSFPAPVMRIFSQPMEPSGPPPPTPTESQPDLATEHIDPVTGASKLDRDGKLLYVKPVEHLEECLDLSEVEGEEGLFETSPSLIDDGTGKTFLTSQQHTSRVSERDGEVLGKYKDIVGIRLYIDPACDITFWRFSFEIELGPKPEHIGYRINNSSALGFWVPAKGQTMSMMYHSGNGFGFSTDRNKMSGPDPMWRDALNAHQSKPFHVMIGGGDQIYNDAAMFDTKYFRDWMSLRCSPESMAHAFQTDIKEELERFLLCNYLRWFSHGLFSMAVSQIPMVNMWNDHDIMGGFGSYEHAFMKTPIFSGLGTLAFKYYLLFQHQCVIEETPANEQSWLLGAYPGPYIKEKSRSVFVSLGGGAKLLALDCMTERSRDDVVGDATYQRIWNRLHNEIARGSVKHLLVVSSLPLAYPRLIWLQKILTSKMADGAKSVFGRFSERFEVDMSTLDSQWTSHTHKTERSWLIEDLQEFAALKSCRVTILSGGVRMAAVGRFYSNPELQIPKENDYRYMLNIVASPIADQPTSQMMADALNQRNKVHEFDLKTKEDLCPAFAHDVDGRSKNNKKLFPRRNWCAIREWQPEPPRSSSPSPERKGRRERGRGRVRRSLSVSRVSQSVGRLARRLSRGPSPNRSVSVSSQRRVSEDSLPSSARRSNSILSSARNISVETLRGRAKSSIRSRRGSRSYKGGWADVYNLTSMEGGLDITISCECNPKDAAGLTTPYRVLVPTLDYEGPFEPSVHREKKRPWWKIGKKGKREGDEEEQEEGDEDEDEEEDEDENETEEDYDHDELQSSDEEGDEQGSYEGQHQPQQRSQQSSGQENMPRQPQMISPRPEEAAAARYPHPTIQQQQALQQRSPTSPRNSGTLPMHMNMDGAVDQQPPQYSEGADLDRLSTAQTAQSGGSTGSAPSRGDGSVRKRKKFLGII